MIAVAEKHVIDWLPVVRGRLVADAPLGAQTWFRVGGAAEVLFRPTDTDDLAAFLRAKPADVPITVIGVASNLLVRDGGVPGIVIRLGRGFAAVERDGTRVLAGAGALDRNVALAAAQWGLAGLEFLSGIPGTLGGAVRMNAGAYGREIVDVLVDAQAVDASGGVHTLARDALGLAYRHSDLPESWIVTRATLQAGDGDRAQIAARIEEIAAARENTQPVRARTGGSTFANPPGEKAWALIERAGCRGLTVGDAQVSEKHCNFLINRGHATAADIEALGEEVRQRVHATTGVALEWEIRRIGVAAGGRP